MSQDEQFMRLALELDREADTRCYLTHESGVLVRDGKVIAEGWHDHIGGLHAERWLSLMPNQEGPTQDPLHSSLEPCNHFEGPLPVQRPYYGLNREGSIGSMDPNPTVRQWSRLLEDNGVKSSLGFWNQSVTIK